MNLIRSSKAKNTRLYWVLSCEIRRRKTTPTLRLKLLEAAIKNDPKLKLKVAELRAAA